MDRQFNEQEQKTGACLRKFTTDSCPCLPFYLFWFSFHHYHSKEKKPMAIRTHGAQLRYIRTLLVPLATGSALMLLFLAGCSDRFDPSTTIGTDILDDLDPTLTGAQYLYRTATESLGVAGLGSYSDTTVRFFPNEAASARRIRQPGLHYTDTVIAIGRKGNLSALGYAEFDNTVYNFASIRFVRGIDLYFEKSGLNDSTLGESAGNTYSVRVDTCLEKSPYHTLTTLRSDRYFTSLDFPLNTTDSNLIAVPLDTSLWTAKTTHLIKKVSTDSTSRLVRDSVVFRDSLIRVTEGIFNNATLDTFYSRVNVVDSVKDSIIAYAQIRIQRGPFNLESDTVPAAIINDRIVEAASDTTHPESLFVTLAGDSSSFNTADTIVTKGVFARVPLKDSINVEMLDTSSSYDTGEVETGVYMEFENVTGDPTIISRSGRWFSTVKDSVFGSRVVITTRQRHVYSRHFFDQLTHAGDTTHLKDSLVEKVDSSAYTLFIYDTLYTDTTLRTTRYEEHYEADTLANYTRKEVAYERKTYITLRDDSLTSVTVNPLFFCFSPAGTDTALFRLRRPQLAIRYVKDTKEVDDRTVLLNAPAMDYSVFETAANPHRDSLPVACWASDRVAVIKVDLRPVWDAMKGTGSELSFGQILTATADIRISDFDSELGRMDLRYALTKSPMLTSDALMRRLTIASSSPSIGDTTVTLSLEDALNDLHKKKVIPNTGYLHVKFDSFNRWVTGTIEPPAATPSTLPFKTLIFASPEK